MNIEAGWKEKREEISSHHLYPPPSSTPPKTNKQTKQVRLQNFKISHSMSRSPRSKASTAENRLEGQPLFRCGHSLEAVRLQPYPEHLRGT